MALTLCFSDLQTYFAVAMASTTKNSVRSRAKLQLWKHLVPSYLKDTPEISTSQAYLSQDQAWIIDYNRTTVETFYCGHLGDLEKCLVYSKTPLMWTLSGPGEVSCIERCSHFRGKFILRKHIWNITKCP